MDTEVKYSDTVKFKITITSNGKLRIKIPKDTDSNIERLWINRCKEINKYFVANPYPYTLRSEARDTRAQLTLRVNTGKHSRFTAIDTVITPIVKENNET